MIRLGLIGLSPENGHPYSWAAIINGYDSILMKGCGFPVISSYLKNKSFPTDQIKGAKVTHVWAQEHRLARQIASTTFIDNVVNHFEDMIGRVDAILLARDDAERHIEFATPFLQAGIPIYIDKPLALTCNDAQKLFDTQRYSGQLFTCSALHYAKELQLSITDSNLIGRIQQIHATTPKDWDRYAVHAIEPALMLMGEDRNILHVQSWHQGKSTTLTATLSGNRQLLITSLGISTAPIALRVIGDRGWKDLIFYDSFTAFSNALQVFLNSVSNMQPAISEKFVMDVVGLIEAGRVR